MSNQQIHQYHQQVIQEQDDQLDTSSESIGRQRHLSMQIGDELEGQVALLDEVDRDVDRHQSRLDGAKKRLRGVGAKAKANLHPLETINAIFKPLSRAEKEIRQIGRASCRERV